ncbi:T9SS type A sorting domain-containing protein [Apibacter sp. HY039]|uniref:T9SS type A sorting domain-containing protein n=1 Tax=Apibacter sp. HY039 TaxID=2501476 RepID=UPI000FEB6EF4|nr:T9SS type A sorting domain-containing protein [Apibacter sp. HY039]
MKSKIYLFLFILFCFCGYLSAQNIEFTNDILKNYLLSSSAENEVAKDINGNPMAIDTNGDGEISLQEALKVYQLKIGINNIYPSTYPQYPNQTETGSSDLTYFTNVRILLYSGTVSYLKSNSFPRFLDATGFTNLKELYYQNGHSFYKEYPFYLKLPEYLPNLKIMDAPLKISYSQAPNLEDLNCSYTVQGSSDNSGTTITYEKLNLSDFKSLKKITANAENLAINNLPSLEEAETYASDSLIMANLPSLKALNINGRYCYLENLPKIDTISFKTPQNNVVIEKHLVIKRLPFLKSLDCKNTITNSSTIRYSGIKTLELEDLPELTSIDCTENLLTSLDLSKNIPNLSSLILKKNNLEAIDVSQNIRLDTLDLSSNYYLKKIDLSKNIQLKKLSLFYNMDIKDLDISNNPLIEDLNISRTSISDIDLSLLKNLKSLNCSDNNITTLDLSKNPNVSDLKLIDYTYYNYTKDLKHLIIKNNVLDSWINEGVLTYRKPGLESICCDNQEEIDLIYRYFLPQSSDGLRFDPKDISVTTNCNQSLGTNEIKTQTEITLYPNPATDFLYINTKEKITKVEIFDTNGRLLISENITSPKVTVSTLPKGSYFMTLHYAKGKINKPFIKN